MSFRFVSFRLVWISFVVFRIASNHSVSIRFFVSFRSFRFVSFRFGSIRFVSVRVVSFRFVPVRSGPVRSGPVRSGPVQSGPVRSGPVRFGSVRFGSVRFRHHLVPVLTVRLPQSSSKKIQFSKI